MSESETESHGSRLAPSALAPHHDDSEARANEPEGAAPAPKRRPGAPPGNRHALKHGRYSAAAQAARAAARARILAGIPDPGFKASTCKAGGGDPPPSISAFKRNNYVAGDHPPQPETPAPSRRRGAQPGNGNALKHGCRSGKRRAVGAEIRWLLLAVKATAAAAHAGVARRQIEEKASKPLAASQGRQDEARAAPSRLPRNKSGVAPQGDGCEGRHGEARAAMLRASNHDARVPNHRERPPHAA
jgi:hypothetical protein